MSLAKWKQCRTNTLDGSGWFANLCSMWHVAKSWWERFKDQIPAGSCNPAPKNPSLLEQSYLVYLKKSFQPSSPGDCSLRFLFPMFPPTPSYQFVTLFILSTINFQPASGFPLCCHFSAAPFCLPRASLLDQYRLIAVEYHFSLQCLIRSVKPATQSPRVCVRERVCVRAYVRACVSLSLCARARLQMYFTSPTFSHNKHVHQTLHLIPAFRGQKILSFSFFFQINQAVIALATIFNVFFAQISEISHSSGKMSVHLGDLLKYQTDHQNEERKLSNKTLRRNITFTGPTFFSLINIILVIIRLSKHKKLLKFLIKNWFYSLSGRDS